MLILLVRHPATAWNVGTGKVSKQGAIQAGPDGELPKVRAWKDDVELAPEAQQEMEDAAARLVGLDIRKIYTSDLVRARAMTQAIVNATNIPALVTPKLRPWHLGEFEGQPITRELLARMTAYMTTRRTEPVPGGESWVDFVHRYLSFLKFVWTMPGEGLCVLVAHGRNAIVAHAWQAAGADLGLDLLAPTALENESTVLDPGQIAAMGPGLPIQQLDARVPIVAQLDPMKRSQRGLPHRIGQMHRSSRVA